MSSNILMENEGRKIKTFTLLYLHELLHLEIDSKLIERKRQDTLEICRIFNEENKYLQSNYASELDINKHNKTNQRIKRSVSKNQVTSSSLNKEDVARVENIVDKLYDDLEQSGTVAYRRRIVENRPKNNVSNSTIQRRFNFAPARLFGPLPIQEKEIKLQSGLPKISWIKKWTHGIIPFYIDSNTYDSLLAGTIIKAFDYFEKVTCIRLQRLRERPTDKRSLQSVEWLYITNPSGIRQCVHSNERKPNTGVQMMVLGYDCLSQGEIVHEVMHVLGFSHEHTRPDRDRYVTIMWNNIKSGYKKYFEVREVDPLSNLPYDFASVLHYPPRAFSKNGQLTIMTENTCPSVVKFNTKSKEVTAKEIEDYYKDRVWPYGVVNYKIKDEMEFTAEERENIKAVLSHIEKETCIEFRDISVAEENSKEEENNKDDYDEPNDDEDKNNRNNTIKVVPKMKDNNSNVTSASDVDNEIIPTEKPDDSITEESANENIKDENDGNKNLSLRFSKSKRRRHTPVVNTEKSTVYTKKIRISLVPLSPSRRHAVNVFEFVRSSKPGCECPPPGRPQGNKVLTINSDCFNSANDLLHLFVHILGLDHQHNMHDRDSYLHILWQNLTAEIKEEMQKTLPPAASAGFAYDYQSVMHYPWLQIKDGVTNVMYPIWNDGWAMGHWQGLSWTDVQKLNTIYKDECGKRKSESQ
ncbi:unnamed protein product, partial [Brenthis ino]